MLQEIRVNEIRQVLNDPCASYWLKHSLRTGLSRDPLDAAHDAEVLAKLLGQQADETLRASPGAMTVSDIPVIEL